MTAISERSSRRSRNKPRRWLRRAAGWLRVLDRCSLRVAKVAIERILAEEVNGPHNDWRERPPLRLTSPGNLPNSACQVGLRFGRLVSEMPKVVGQRARQKHQIRAVPNAA